MNAYPIDSSFRMIVPLRRQNLKFSTSSLICTILSSDRV